MSSPNNCYTLHCLFLLHWRKIKYYQTISNKKGTMSEAIKLLSYQKETQIDCICLDPLLLLFLFTAAKTSLEMLHIPYAIKMHLTKMLFLLFQTRANNYPKHFTREQSWPFSELNMFFSTTNWRQLRQQQNKSVKECLTHVGWESILRKAPQCHFHRRTLFVITAFSIKLNY